MPRPPCSNRSTSPADLEDLSYEELDVLAQEIREFIVDAVDDAGSGHLGSNLGAVELTLALHRVFDSPEDIILWDTGHQAYVHKIVTGRQAGFAELRQAGGLSGYPSRAESEHDWIENSHASTDPVLRPRPGRRPRRASWATGRRVVAVIGDGSMTGGMAFEGLNNLGHSGRKAIIILNDNGRSYAPTDLPAGREPGPAPPQPDLRCASRPASSSILAATCRCRRAASTGASRPPRPPSARCWSRRRSSRRSASATRARSTATTSRASSGRCATPPSSTGPIVVHVLTQKGKGHPPAENDSDQAPARHRRRRSRASYTAAFTEALIKEAEERPELVAITAAMPDSTGLLPFDERFPGRCFDVGIAEQHAVTSAAGMAMGGLRPVVAVYSTFLTRAIDQVNLRRRPAPPAGGLLPRPGRHHRRRRRRPTTACSTWCCSPRCRA